MADSVAQGPLPLPEPDPGVRVQREWSARAWSGPRSSLERIETIANEVMRSAYEDYAAKTVDPEERKVLGLRMMVVANIRDRSGSITRIGTIASSLAQMDSSDVESVLLGTQKDSSGREPFIYIYFRRSGDQGVKLQVRGSDQQWVAGTYDRLVEQISRHVPRWHLLRNWLLSISSGAVAGAGIAVAIGGHGPETPHVAVRALLGLMLGGGAGLVILYPAFSMLFPGFEILGPDYRSAARKILGAVIASLSLMLAIAGLVVPFLS